MGRLGRREKYVLFGGVGILGVCLLCLYVVVPAFEYVESVHASVTARKVTLQKMELLKAEYEALRSSERNALDRFESREKGFTLFSFLDRLAGDAAIKDRIKYMKPSTAPLKDSTYKLSQVEMKLENITMEKLMAYLYKVETSANEITIKRISITETGKEKGFVDAVLQVVTFAT